MENLSSFISSELGIPDSISEEIVKFYKTKSLQKGQFLVEQGKYCQHLCFIDGGYLRFYSETVKKEITHWIFGKNHMITDVSSFFLRQSSKWNIQALSETTVFTLHYSDYQQMRKEIPEWDHYERLFLIKLMSALENRVYSLLSMSAEERYQFLFNSDSNMFNELPLQYLASMLGMTPETLSRIRAKTIS